MAKPVVLILGATGQIGRATVKYLAQSCASKLDIRAGTRNPSTAPESLKLPGVQVVKAAVGDDKQHLKTVFNEVDRLFLIPPSDEQGEKLVLEAADLIKEVGVKHVVLLSALTGPIPPDHKYATKKTFYFIQKRVEELFPDATVINHPFFMENVLGFADFKSSSKITMPLNPDAPKMWMAADDAGKFNAAILREPEKHKGKYYRLYNDSRSMNELIAYISEATGRKFEYAQQTYDQFAEDLRKAGCGEKTVKLFCSLYHMVDEGEPLLTGLSQDHFNVTGDQPITLQQWCQQHIKSL